MSVVQHVQVCSHEYPVKSSLGQMTRQAADAHMNDEVTETVNHVIRLTLPFAIRASSVAVLAHHKSRHRRPQVEMVG